MLAVREYNTYLSSNLIPFYGLLAKCQLLLTSDYYPLHLMSKMRNEITRQLSNEIRRFEIDSDIPPRNYSLLYPRTALLFDSEDFIPVVRFLCEMPVNPNKRDRSLWLLLFTCSVMFNRLDWSPHIFDNIPHNAIYISKYIFPSICKYAPTEFTQWFYNQLTEKYNIGVYIRMDRIIDSCPLPSIIWLLNNGLSRLHHHCLEVAKVRPDYEEVHRVYREKKRSENYLFDINKYINKVA